MIEVFKVADQYEVSQAMQSINEFFADTECLRGTNCTCPIGGRAVLRTHETKPIDDNFIREILQSNSIKELLPALYYNGSNSEFSST